VTDERSIVRLVAFTDAVVAIAITLLVLPLVAFVPEATGKGTDTTAALVRLLADHVPQLVAFALSFALIARFWWGHHRILEPVRSWSTALVLLDLAWVFLIVVLPLPTAILPLYDPWPVSFAFYGGVLLASSCCLTAMALLVHRSIATATTRVRLISSSCATVAFAAALVLGLAVPPVHFWALTLLMLTPPFEVLLRRHYARRPVPRRLSEASETLNA
jgi:uncharacterized membrane protein